MSFDFWGAFYHSELQSLWLLLIVPFLFSLYLLLGRVPAGTPAQRFLRVYAWVFTLGTLLDPLATGPLSRALDLSGVAATALVFCFVLAGDFRVLLLLFAEGGAVADLRRAARRAAAFTLLVPAATGVLYSPAWLGVTAWPSQTMWLIYELCFAALALWLRRRAPTPALRAIALYAFAYYALWASADVLILSGVDAGWALRVFPNQLYYAFFVPLAYFRLLRG